MKPETNVSPDLAGVVESSAPQLFNYGPDSAPVRTVQVAAQPWFVARDVCVVLGLMNSRQALEAIPLSQKGVTITYTLGGAQRMAIINEPGLYRLIFKSRKPEAEAFQNWVFTEVLPAIRKTGRYSTGGLADTADPDAERERLWTAYEQALSPAVQATILAALGFDPVVCPPKVIPALPQPRAIQHPPVPAAEVLAAWEAALSSGQLAVSATWIRRYGEYLAVVPARLMALPAFHAWTRGAVRAGLQSHPAWQSLVFVPGRHKLRVRFAGVGHPLHCWLFHPDKLPEGLRAALAGVPG
jgi:prophage antirepressor-like protein